MHIKRVKERHEFYKAMARRTSRPWRNGRQVYERWLDEAEEALQKNSNDVTPQQPRVAYNKMKPRW